MRHTKLIMTTLLLAGLGAACSDDDPGAADSAASVADAGAADRSSAPDSAAPDLLPAADYLQSGTSGYGARCEPGKKDTCQAGLTCLRVLGQSTTMGYCTKTCTKSSDCTAITGASCVFSSGSSKLCGFVCDGDNPHCPGGLGCVLHPTVAAYFCTGDPPARCGNGKAEAGEDCDDKDHDGLKCGAFGYSGGSLGCKACRFDTSGCTGSSTCKLPPRRCGDGTDCMKLEEMLPRSGGDGFKVYTLSQWAWLRRDTFQLVKYASAATNCVMPGSWPISMADGSAKDGTTPKDSKGKYRHPPGSHNNGVDIDVAYYQTGTKDNDPRPVCDETNNAGIKVNHCTESPNTLDLPRSTFFLGKIFESGRIRVCGVDGKIGPIMMAEAAKQNQKGLISNRALKTMKVRTRWEITNTGQGWFLSHHHHVHVSTIYLGYTKHKTGKSLWPDPGPPITPEGATSVPASPGDHLQ